MVAIAIIIYSVKGQCAGSVCRVSVQGQRQRQLTQDCLAVDGRMIGTDDMKLG